MSQPAANLPLSPDQLANELMNRSFEDLTKMHKARDLFFSHYINVYQKRSETIIQSCKGGDLIRKVRFFLNWQSAPHRKVEVIGEDTIEKTEWRLDFIYSPSDIKTLQHLYFTPLGNPDLHSSWIVLAMFLDENFEPLPPVFTISGTSIVRNINT
jgi:hypothetical protein